MKHIKIAEAAFDGRMRLGKEIPTKDFNKWIKALESGKYKQGHLSLNYIDPYGDICFCALGVLCDVVIPKKKLKRKRDRTIKGTMPADQPMAPAWVLFLNRDLYIKMGECISSMNDSLNLSFKEIAAELKLNYKTKKKP